MYQKTRYLKVEVKFAPDADINPAVAGIVSNGFAYDLDVVKTSKIAMNTSDERYVVDFVTEERFFDRLQVFLNSHQSVIESLVWYSCDYFHI